MRNIFKKIVVFLFVSVLIFLIVCGNSLVKKILQLEIKIQIKIVVAVQQIQVKLFVLYIIIVKGFIEVFLLRVRVNFVIFDAVQNFKFILLEVKLDSVFIRVQAVYIIWNIINKVDWLKVENVFVLRVVYDLWDSYFLGKDVII